MEFFLALDPERRAEGVPYSALRHVLAGDPSNRRRAVLSLIRRGDLEVVEGEQGEQGEKRLKLCFLTAVATLWRLDPPAYYSSEWR